MNSARVQRVALHDWLEHAALRVDGRGIPDRERAIVAGCGEPWHRASNARHKRGRQELKVGDVAAVQLASVQRVKPTLRRCLQTGFQLSHRSVEPAEVEPAETAHAYTHAI